MIGLEIEGIEAVKLAMSAVREGAIPAAGAALLESGQVIYGDFATYADPVPTSDYVRTYEYRDSLEPLFQITGDTAVSYEVIEHSPKSIWLRGDGESYPGAWMHVGRWQSIIQIMARRVPETVDKIVQSLVDLITRAFGG